jgi:hypothetical protein
MTVIEIRPHRWGWKAFEAPGGEPVFQKKDQAIGYAETRACPFAPEQVTRAREGATSRSPGTTKGANCPENLVLTPHRRARQHRAALSCLGVSPGAPPDPLSAG